MNNAIDNSREERLYSRTGIAVASVLGSFFAGCYMIHRNYRVIGRTRDGIIAAFVISLIYSFLLVALFLMDVVPYEGTLVSLTQGIGMFAISHFLFIDIYEEHTGSGKGYYSMFSSVVVSLAFALIGFLAFLTYWLIWLE